MESLDPRITRLDVLNKTIEWKEQKSPDQLSTFEVFIQRREGVAFEHVGIVHSSDEELALILAKEQFSRRATCAGMMVTRTQNVVVSPYTDMEDDVYDLVEMETSGSDEAPAGMDHEDFLIFHLTRRGKQHKQAGTISAVSVEEAFSLAKNELQEDKPVLNVWLIKDKDLFKFLDEDRDIWMTLPEKKHRDVTSYRAKSKIDSLKNGNR